MKKVVIFGIGKIADVVFAEFMLQKDFEVVAFTCDREFMQETSYRGLPVVPFDEVESHFPPERFAMFVAVGYHDINRVRARIYNQVKEKGYELPNCVSAKAQVYPFTQIGDNCLIMNDATVQPFAEIGNQVFLWSNTVVAHHGRVGHHCWFASEAVIGGNTSIGAECFLGLNATVGHELTIGERSFIGAGTLVLKSAPSKSVFLAKDTEKMRLDSDAFMRISKIK